MANTIDRLKAQLLASGIQQKNQALFQVINQLIDALSQSITTTSAQITSISGGSLTGLTGPQGIPGVDGFDGIDGETGPQGLRGEQGLIGPTGPSFGLMPLDVECEVSDNNPFLGLLTLPSAEDGARVEKTANQSITNAAWNVLTWDSEDFDQGNLHSNSVNTSRITIVKGGIYVIVGGAVFDINSTGSRFIAIRKNNFEIAVFNTAAFPTYTLRLNVSTIDKLVPADYVELFVFQDSGGALDVIASVPTFFSAIRVSD